jgi:NADPH:quinone reductase-like Zn-dependent oxidoreductase
VIDRVFGFDEARAALEYLKTGSHFGKVALAR